MCVLFASSVEYLSYSGLEAVWRQIPLTHKNRVDIRALLLRFSADRQQEQDAASQEIDPDLIRLQVSYRYAKQLSFGRLYADAPSLQGLAKAVRSRIIARGYYVDIDTVCGMVISFVSISWIPNLPAPLPPIY
jgi:hypothetical protein